MDWKPLTVAERTSFNENGYVVLPNVLAPELRAALISAVKARQLPRGDDKQQNDADILGKGAAFLELMDLPSVFPKIFGLLGLEHLGQSFSHDCSPSPQSHFLANHLVTIAPGQRRDRVRFTRCSATDGDQSRIQLTICLSLDQGRPMWSPVARGLVEQ